MQYYYEYNSPIGELYIAQENDAITQVSVELPTDSERKLTELIKRTIEELKEYFDAKRRDFDIPINPHGTEFQKKAWDNMRQIPYGHTASYSQIGGGSRYSRAAGGAANKNKVLIIIPCHRVVGKNGSLTGFALGLDIKEFLLDLEKKNSASQI